ncbi:MAG: Pyruvate carboxylase subunit A [Methanomassiliicoccales archaeon PtaU1.Bin124]|nr:MAG: Pyruvate carboxylase subunit A [Methanomassiliicoccales archaeon PtaU1.Bin124]
MSKKPKKGKLMVIGSGPIVIGQAAEFDFSGSQACRSLREEGYETVLVNSNPATIQTDLEMADIVYIEPLNVETIAKIIEREKVQGVLSGMGGQTALNLCSELAEKGYLERLNCRLLGTQPRAIALSEDRELFKQTMIDIGEPVPVSKTCHNIEEAKEAVKLIGKYPVLIRPAYTLGGTGGGIAYSEEELVPIVGRGLIYSRIHQVLIEESVIGWKEFEYEVMRDKNDNCIIICSMENLDAMGIHTGESIVVAPVQTLNDVDHQRLRTASIKIIRALGIEGGCNVQFAFDPLTKEYRVIEVNPRVSRSSALASKATGYPIARVAAKIAIGKTLDEIQNKITGKTSAAFEPTIDYCVIKIPRWPFDKFRTVDKTLGTQMKSTGEVMAIGRSIEEGIMKAIRSLETDKIDLEPERWNDVELEKELKVATDKRLYAIAEGIRRNIPLQKLAEWTAWDEFFVRKVRNLVDMEKELAAGPLDKDLLRRAKRLGFPDESIGKFARMSEEHVREMRLKHGIVPTYKMVDTCAAEFEAATPYFYSTYEEQCEAKRSPRKKVIIVGAGPIRIGQGIEFDYCCVHGVMACQEEGVDAIVINNNPETVSTDYDISDRLYFEPLTLEDVLNVIEKEDADGVVVQFGGQTSVNLAVPLEKALKGKKAKVLGTDPDMIDIAEDRKRWTHLMRELGIKQPDSGTGHSHQEVKEAADRIGYPVLLRPSYVLGGRGMEIIYNEEELKTYVETAVRVSKSHPVLIDKYLSHAIEIDVDAICDGEDVFIGGILEHIEEAGVHSGDATMVMPAHTIPSYVMDRIIEITIKTAKALQIKGLMNLQLAVKDNEVYMLEANPRASRTVPFVSKAIGVPLAKLATKVMLGKKLKDLGYVGVAEFKHIAVKASVFPFLKLPGVDSILGPEMKSTGEVMGIDSDFNSAIYKALVSAGMKLPLKGGVYITVADSDKKDMLVVAKCLQEMGFTIYATKGTATFLKDHNVPATTVYKVRENTSPDALGLMRMGQINLIINTPTYASGSVRDGAMMRRLAVELEIPFLTTIQAAKATVGAIRRARQGDVGVSDISSYHEPVV